MLVRQHLLDRIHAAHAPVVFISAPVGYGKTELVDALVASKAALRCNVWHASSSAEVRAAIVQTLLRSATSEAGPDLVQTAFDRWGSARKGSAFVIEGLQQSAIDPDCVALLRRLIATRPRDASVVLSTRVPGDSFGSLCAPHEIVRLCALDLRISEDGLLQAFGELVDDGDLLAVERWSEGWPAVVLVMLRLAREGRLSEALASPDRLAEELSDYVYDQLIAPLRLEVQYTCVALTMLSKLCEADLPVLLEATDLRLAAEMPFISIDAFGFVSLHPLVKLILLRRYRAQSWVPVEQAATALHASGQIVLAARLFAEAGKLEEAAHAIDTMEKNDALASQLRECMSKIEPLTMLRYPRVWSYTMGFRRFHDIPERLTAEAETVLALLPAQTDEALRLDLLLHLGVLLGDSGRHAEGLEALGELANEDAVIVRALLLAQSGRMAEAGALRETVGQHPRSPQGLCRYLVLNALLARASGRAAVERHLLEQAVQAARGSDIPCEVATALVESAIAAWISADDDHFGSSLSQLRSYADTHEAAEIRRFLTALEEPERPVECTMPLLRAFSLLHRACTADTAEAAQAAAVAALAASRAGGLAFLQVLANLAVACLVPHQRSAAIEDAQALAMRISPELSSIVKNVKEKSPVSGFLSKFLGRFERRTPSLAENSVRVELLSGVVRLGAQPIHLSERSLALLFALSCHDRALTREQLCDLIWPALDEEGAVNALKMCVHRVRTQLQNKHVIVSTAEGYRLGGGVSVDYRYVEEFFTKTQHADVFNDDQRYKLLHFHTLLCAGRPPKMLCWEWFTPFEMRIVSLTRAIGEFLSEDALKYGRPEVALAIGRKQSEIDPCDEDAREMVIRAYLAGGDRIAALREFTDYRTVLKKELDAEPSRKLANLARTGTD